ncbi:NADH-quinone oxidoreductase subunit N [Virgisporangium ochraceum]|uniref:NADH-quinone oxidoreductase subunit N n=1 Tax=Virgisporangium ochraceum TaxID=65505 RepID=A0A8J4E8M7_9ACTN|nr:proton-conducting transporter membrane subunit [Virgisporangium ochraceum]GIJ65398.1 NADH-quinone oxidoreductase subunit N [Virgisporangium ochraceum]
MRIDHVALIPAYLAAGTAVLVLLADLFRFFPLVVGLLGSLSVAGGAFWLSTGSPRTSFCVDDHCSFVVTDRSAVLMAVFALLTAAVLAFSATVRAPMGEYCFLLTCSMTGGVVLAGAGDLITLIVALETLTLPLYVLVALRRTLPAADGAVTFFVVSVVSTAISLLGAGLLYATTGAVHFPALFSGLASAPSALRPLAVVGIVVLIGGLAFKVAAVPLHAWAPSTYDGAPLPVAAYLSTASKLGGVVALVYVVDVAVAPERATAVAAVVVLSLLTMTVGNLVALRQRRMVRLLAWSSIAQAGYILAAIAVDDGGATALTYAVFFVALELAAFGAVIALRPSLDGGALTDYAGAGRGAPWRSAVLLLALAGLAGLPPGIAGLFAKVAVVRSLVDSDATWLAVVVAVNAVVGLAYYVRAGAALFVTPTVPAAPATPHWAVAAALVLVALAALVLGFAPQVVFDATALR